MNDTQQTIVNILDASGESLLDDEGVDQKVALEIADDIIDALKPKSESNGRYNVDTFFKDGQKNVVFSHNNLGIAITYALELTEDAIKTNDGAIVGVAIDDTAPQGETMFLLHNGEKVENPTFE